MEKKKRLSKRHKREKRILKYAEETDSPRIRAKKYRARFHSTKEGMFNSIKSSLGDRYIAPFAIAINASNSLIAMLTSISGLLGPLSQMFGSKLMEKYSRKRIWMKSAFIEALVWIPLILVAVLFYFNIVTEILPLILLFMFAIYIFLANLPAPPWFSLMGDLVNEKYRGRWFSKRAFVIGIVTIVFSIGSALFLDYLTGKGFQILGFCILFFLAFLFKIYAWRVVKKIYEPELNLKVVKDNNFSLMNFLLNSWKNNFGRFSLFRASLGFSTSIAAPFFAVYLLRYLGFDYFLYMVITLAGTVFSLFVVDLWGIIADRFGNYRVMVLALIFIPFVPILWMLSSSPLYLAIVPAFISGIAWAGFNLSSVNFIYDNVSAEKRGTAVSYYNFLNGLGIFLGAGFGALLIKYLNFDFIGPIFAIFVISFIARGLVDVLILPLIKEVRKTQKVSPKILGRTIVKSARPTLIEEGHEIVSIKRYLWK